MSESRSPNYEEETLEKEHSQVESLPAPQEAGLIEAHSREAQAKQIEKARDSISETATSGSNLEASLSTGESTDSSADTTYSSVNGNELRKISKQRELSSIRNRLSPSQKALSQVIHQPAVRFVSDIASSSVSRPSGMLGGGLVALIGTSGYYLLAKRIGFSYNYTVFLVLFLGGFIVGVLFEFIIHLLLHRKRHQLK